MCQNSESGRDHNPAVQLQGPFLQSKLIPPPTHRNVIMISAGTGVNPMFQLIRDYLLVGSSNRDAGMGTHSRLVLLWQNSVEGDLYCADELTTLQAKAKGLLEVTALISGDMTRRNVPGNAFRRAKAKLMKKGAEAGLVSTRVQPQGEGVDQESAEQALERDMPSGLDRLELGRELSRVSEEDSNFTRASRSNRSMGGGRDLERGGSSGRRDLPWLSSSGKRRSKSGGRQDRGGGGGGGGESKTPSDSGIEHPRRGEGVSARSPVVADGENIWSEEAGQEDRGGNYSGSTDALSSDPRQGLPSWRAGRNDAARNVMGCSSGHSAETQRSGIRLADSIRAAGVDRGRWSKGAGSKNTGGPPKGTVGRTGGGGGGKGKGSHFFAGKKTRVDMTEYSSGDGQSEAAAGARRKTKRGASRRRSAGRVAGRARASPLDDVRRLFMFSCSVGAFSIFYESEEGGWPAWGALVLVCHMKDHPACDNPDRFLLQGMLSLGECQDARVRTCYLRRRPKNIEGCLVLEKRSLSLAFPQSLSSEFRQRLYVPVPPHK